MLDSLIRIKSISRKEFFHIIHDVRSLIIILVIPVLMLILFGYALNMELQDIDLAVVDHSLTPESKKLVQRLEGNNIFNLFYYQGKLQDIEILLLNRKARAILIIDKDFSVNVKQKSLTKIQMIIDASDPNAAMMINNYCNVVINNYNQKSSENTKALIDIQPRIWYNPDMKSAYFFVPGLIALILVMISALLTSITITREKETGTMEQILVSPVKPLEIILGKVFPYIFMAFFDGLIILILGMILFDIPFTGGYLSLLILTTVYIITALCLGLMISTSVSTQQVSMMVAIAITLLPTIMLSGFIFPLKSMPFLIQLISYIVPAKYYLVIIRGIMLKSNSLIQLLTPALALCGMTLFLVIRALKKFSLNLES